MDHFIKLSRTLGRVMKVYDTVKVDPSIEKIGDIIICKGKKIDSSMWLGISPTDNETDLNQSYDMSSGLFATMSPSPDPNMISRGQRDMIFISAPSGTGKSSWTGQYARAWQETMKLKIIVLSEVTEDRAFEGVTLKRIPFSKLVDERGEPNECIQMEDLKDSLVIMDDIDAITNLKLLKWIRQLRNKCLEVGRHHNISLICTTHHIMANNVTKTLLMEATKVVIFPFCGAGEQLKRYLKQYIGMNERQIKQVFSLKSSWIMINKSTPRYIMHADGAYFLE